jgi:hypothetical protein
MAPYRAGHLYFHGGASLAEAVVPVLVARLDSAAETQRFKPDIKITYKAGAKRITTRLPVFEVSFSVGDDESAPMFGSDAWSGIPAVEIMIEAQNSKGEVIGEPRPGGDVNPATRYVTLMPGQRKHIALRMDEEFRGKFTVKALNPTTLAAYCSLALETDFTE